MTQTLLKNRGSLHAVKYSGYFWGVLTPLICTVIAWPLHSLLGEASVLMLYMLGVFLVASRFGRGASMVASLLSAPVFAFHLPFGILKISSV
jgi:two-component system sensor histidine kinase KdpD